VCGVVVVGGFNCGGGGDNFF